MRESAAVLLMSILVGACGPAPAPPGPASSAPEGSYSGSAAITVGNDFCIVGQIVTSPVSWFPPAFNTPRPAANIAIDYLNLGGSNVGSLAHCPGLSLPSLTVPPDVVLDYTYFPGDVENAVFTYTGGRPAYCRYTTVCRVGRTVGLSLADNGQGSPVTGSATLIFDLASF